MQRRVKQETAGAAAAHHRHMHTCILHYTMLGAVSAAALCCTMCTCKIGTRLRTCPVHAQLLKQFALHTCLPCAKHQERNQEPELHIQGKLRIEPAAATSSKDAAALDSNAYVATCCLR